MRVKSLREHYYSNDGGINWIPKQGFNSQKEIKDAGFSRGLWERYRCNFCGKLHVSKVREALRSDDE